MASLGRREFILSSTAAGVVASIAALGRSRRASAAGGWGELVPDPDGIFDLPEGFSYAIVETAGDAMSDGYRVPGRPDGMACFAGPDDTLILMRNHEIDDDITHTPYNDGQDPPAEAYDPTQLGGVTRVVLDANTLERISSNLVLVGTTRNCAGGPSPWGWLSCEENTDINGESRHGYTFVCPTDADSVQAPQAVPGYGRFNHEAVAIDPSNFHAYLTEDRIDGCLYRFVPTDMNDPFTGQLQALKVVGEDVYQTGNMDLGAVVDIEWVDVEDPDPDEDTVRDEAKGKGAAVIVRGEGIWFHEGQVYVCATAGGPAFRGQIFRLLDGDEPTLELVVRVDDVQVLENPDNITVAPWGDVFIAEDGDLDQYIRVADEDGQVCDFGRNALSDSELAGVCFSPDGGALFVNMQEDGLTLVITGPFQGGGGETGDTGETETGEDEIGDDTTDGDSTGSDTAEDVTVDDGCDCTTDDAPGLTAAAVAVAAVGLGAALKSDRSPTDRSSTED